MTWPINGIWTLMNQNIFLYMIVLYYHSIYMNLLPINTGVYQRNFPQSKRLMFRAFFFYLSLVWGFFLFFLFFIFYDKHSPFKHYSLGSKTKSLGLFQTNVTSLMLAMQAAVWWNIDSNSPIDSFSRGTVVRLSARGVAVVDLHTTVWDMWFIKHHSIRTGGCYWT